MALFDRKTQHMYSPWVAGGISRASAFLLVVGSREHEWRSREKTGEESSWIPSRASLLVNSLAGFGREYGGSAAHSPAPESHQLRRLTLVNL